MRSLEDRTIMGKAVIDRVRLMARYVDPRFAEQLCTLRRARGLSLKGLYRIAHVSVSALSEYETDADARLQRWHRHST